MAAARWRLLDGDSHYEMTCHFFPLFRKTRKPREGNFVFLAISRRKNSAKCDMIRSLDKSSCRSTFTPSRPAISPPHFLLLFFHFFSCYESLSMRQLYEQSRVMQRATSIVFPKGGDIFLCLCFFLHSPTPSELRVHSR